MWKKHGPRHLPLLAGGAMLALALLAQPAVGRWGSIWLTGKDPRDMLLDEALEVRVSVDFDVPTELEEIIEFLNEAISRKLPIRNALHLDPRATTFDPRAVRISMKRARVRRVLNLLLLDASTPGEEAQRNELSFTPYYQGGVIYITNKRRLIRLNMKRKVFRIYDVRDLLVPLFGGGGREDDDDD